MKTMKKFQLVGLLVVTILFAQSCMPDDEPITPKPVVQIEEEEEAIDPEEEETPEEEPEEETSNGMSNEITDNIIIDGSDKITGAPPTPNGAISLDLSSVTKTGLPEEGFNIDFSSETDVVGAYIQFKATDATVADSYFDVDLLANAESSKSGLKTKSKKRIASKPPSENSINIDFTPQLQTGSFCYVICVYDQAGNISAPQEVCINVSNWGGNTNLVGTWNLTYNEEIFEGETDTETVGVEDCDDPVGNNTNDTRCYLIEYWNLTFNSDGTFESEIKEFNRDTADEPDFVDFDIEILKGNWSYDPAAETLLLASYFYQYEENGVLEESETNDVGDWDVSAVQRIVVDATSLQLIWDELDNDGDGNIDETYIEYYEKQ